MNALPLSYVPLFGSMTYPLILVYSVMFLSIHCTTKDKPIIFTMSFVLSVLGGYAIGHHFKLISLSTMQGAGRSSEVERSLMVRWVVGSILHGVDPLSYFSFQPVVHDWCNKGRGMYYPVYGMVHIKEPLLLIRK